MTEIEVPGQLTPGLTQDFVVYTASPADDPVSVPLHVKVVDRFDNVLHREEIQTAKDGRGRWRCPAVAMMPGVRLRVEARSKEITEQQVAQQEGDESQGPAANFVEAELPVTRQEPLSYYLLEKPTAQDGEPVRVTVWGLERFGLGPAAPPVDDVVVTDHDSMQRIQPEWSESVQENMVEGTLDFSRAQPQRALALTEKTELREQLSPLQVERAKDLSRDSTFRKAGQSPIVVLAAETTAPGQRVYGFQANDVEADTKLASSATAGDEGRKELEAAKKDAVKPEIAEQNAEKQAFAKQKVDMKRRQVVAAGQPVELKLSADQAGKPLEAKVEARGIEVVRQRVEPRTERSIKDGKEQESGRRRSRSMCL